MKMKKFSDKRYKSVSLKIIKSENLAELVGIVLGDGCLSRSCKKYNVYVCGHKFDDFEYHDKVIRKLFLDVFNKTVNISKKKNENTIYMRFRDKTVFSILHSLGIPIGKKYGFLHIPDWIKRNNFLFYSFIRELVDTDGDLSIKKRKIVSPYPIIRIRSKSKEFLTEILTILRDNDFYGNIYTSCGCSTLSIPGYQNFSKWLELIGFNNMKHIRKIEAHLGPNYAPDQNTFQSEN